MDEFETEVRGLLARVRQELGVAIEPVAAYRGSAEERRRCDERLGVPAAWV
jgi:L-rhamnose isomerase